MADGEIPGAPDRPGPAGDDSIWSTDELPVRDEPLDIVWAKRPAAPDEALLSIHPGPVLDEPVVSLPAGTTSHELRLRPKLLIGAAGLVTAAIVVGMLVRSGDADESAVPDSTTDAQTDVEATTTDPPTTLELPSATASSGGSQADALEDASIGPIEVELPATVAAIQTPTEVVMLTARGLVHTLSLPSGRVRSVALAGATDTSMFGGGNVVVGPEAAAILVADGRSMVIVPRTGPPISVGANEFGADIGGLELRDWVRSADGSARFVVAVYPLEWTGASSFVSIGLDGEAGPLLLPQAMEWGLGLTTPEGTWIVNDAGGAYEVDSSGTSRRIDGGDVQAAAQDHRLVRECDDSLRCSTVLVQVSTGERRSIDPDILPDDFDSMTFGMSLAPDGSAVSVARSGSTQERVLIDLDAGEVAKAPTVYWPPRSTWAADSSGVFDTATGGPGLQFIGRNGETIGFGAGLGEIVALGVRWPDAEVDPMVTVVSDPVSAARPVGPTGITLIGELTGGGMAYIDIDAGVAQSWATTERLGGDLTLIESADAILAFGKGNEPAFAFRQGVQEPLDAVFATAGVKLPGPVDGTIWVPTPEPVARSSGVGYRLVTSDGLPVDSDGAAFDLPGAELIGSDGRGGLVVSLAGDVFTVGVDGTERLTSGELVAIADDTAYVRECSDVLTCGITRIDRRSGVRSSPDGAFADGNLSTPTRLRGVALGSSVSPDGDVLMVQLPNLTTPSASDTTWHFVDTTRGRTTVIDAFEPDQPVVWSADSNFAALLADSTLFVFDRGAGELIPLSAPQLRSIGPASSASLSIASTD